MKLRVLVHDYGKQMKPIEGRKLKDYPLGLTVEDERGVVYYVSHDRVLGPVEEAAPRVTLPGVVKVALPGLTPPRVSLPGL